MGFMLLPYENGYVEHCLWVQPAKHRVKCTTYQRVSSFPLSLSSMTSWFICVHLWFKYSMWHDLNSSDTIISFYNNANNNNSPICDVASIVIRNIFQYVHTCTYSISMKSPQRTQPHNVRDWFTCDVDVLLCAVVRCPIHRFQSHSIFIFLCSFSPPCLCSV